jgi:carbon-monoxide dehydrogenase medium subunit
VAYYRPRNLSELQKIYCALPLEDTRLIAGGTDLMVRIKKGQACPNNIIDLSLVQEMYGIRWDSDFCWLGANTTHMTIVRDQKLKRFFPILKSCCEKIGSRQIRSIATLAGNICNASPAADGVLALLILDAQFIILKIDGKRETFEAKDFFLGPGQTRLLDKDVLCQIKLPIERGKVPAVYYKFAKTDVDISTLGLACSIELDKDDNIKGNCRIAIGSAAPTPIRAFKTERFLIGKRINDNIITSAINIIHGEINPISDHRASKEYRLDVAGAFLRSALMELSLFRKGSEF